MAEIIRQVAETTKQRVADEKPKRSVDKCAVIKLFYEKFFSPGEENSEEKPCRRAA